ncbi:MAG TPA: universal stress protein [Candidatus Acidoferrales bacterium]|nr:universal stress protein [Candidatus Acidoferrales bacterium]
MNTATRIEEETAQRTPAGKQTHPAKIMVATDFSPASRPAVDYAVSLAKRFGSRLYLTHVIRYVVGHAVMEPGLAAPTLGELVEISRREAADIVNSGCLRGVPCEVLIEEGPLWPTMEGLIEKHGIDMVVVGTHGLGDTMKAVFGSSAEEIFRHARIPVLIVGPGTTSEAPAEARFQNILFATALGPGAEREAAVAFGLAQEHRCRLMMLHVTERPDGFSEHDSNLEKKAITHRLQELVPVGCEPVCRPEFHMAYGEPVREILRFAREHAADLIVIGAKKQGAFAGHAPHSKAFGVVREAGCPVLTIRS